MIRILIIEDELAAAERVKKMLLRSGMSVSIIAILDSVTASVKWLNENEHPDLIILDIELADGQSFEIFRQVEVDSQVIFTTAYDAFAIKAFEVNSIDYLLKPIDEEKLRKALSKYRPERSMLNSDILKDLLGSLKNSKPAWKNRFLVYAGSSLKSIETSDISFFYSLEKGTYLCTSSNHHYAVESSLDKIMELIDPEFFFRINRQQIISYRFIRKIFVISRSRIKIVMDPPQKEEFLVSTARTHEFRKWLDR